MPKKQVSAAKAKICGLSISIGQPLQISNSRNWLATILLMAEIGIRFPLQLKNELVLGCQFLLYAYSGKPIATTYQRTHFQREMRIISSGKCALSAMNLNGLSAISYL
jgi:hypothetical protein